MPTRPSVTKATLADVPQLAQTLALAFQDDPSLPGCSPTTNAAAQPWRLSWHFAFVGLPFPTTRAG